MEKKASWAVTLVTQVCLCLALFLAFNVGQRQYTKPMLLKRADSSRPFDFHFISVGGGFRPLKQQTHLLKQMEKVAKMYNARFVVNTSELGEEDPLMHSGTGLFPSLKVPWYTTRTSKGQGGGYYLTQIKMPYDLTLDIIVLDTGLLQDPLSDSRFHQLHWLTRTLESSSSKWCIAVGFHSLVACDGIEDHLGKSQAFEPLRRILLKFGVNAYLSTQECTNHTHEVGVSYIWNPSSRDRKREAVDGFLLHRVSSLEITTYLVASTGDIMYRKVLHQRGREVF